MKYINGNFKKTILVIFLISLSLPVAAEYKIIFGLSSFDLPDPPIPEEPKAQSVLSFDGVDDYVEISDSSELDFGGTKGPISMEAWVNDNAYNIFRDQKPIEFSADRVALNGESSGWNSFSGSEVVSGEWTHCAFTWDGNTVTLYKNGTVDATFSFSETLNTQSYSVLGIMSRVSSSDQFGGGSVSDLRIWNTVRTQTEIQNNMDKELTGDETGLVAHYKLDSGSGSTAIDNAGNNDGTINGANWVEK